MKVKNTYLLLVTIFGLVSLVIYSTYAMFTASLDIGGFVDLTASSLPTDTSVVEYERLTLSAGETKIIELNITNTTDSSLYYGVWYEMIEPTSITDDIVIAKLDTSASETIGELSSSSSTTVTLILENNTTDSVVINLGVGYSETSSLNLPTNRNIVTATGSEGIDMSGIPSTTPVDFDYSGSAKSYTAPTTGKYKLEVWGAQGGSGYTYTTGGGAGGYSYGTINLNEGDKLYVYVGGQGSVSAGASTTRSGAGFNANSSSVANSATAANYAGGGGGGWYGGGGGTYRYGGGGGGSGFVLTSSTKSNTPSGYLITDTSYYLEDAATVAGNTSFTSPTGTPETGHSGNGYARISYISTLPSLNGLTDLSISPGTSYDLLSDVTCVDNGSGCTLVKASISDTSTLAVGTYEVAYIVKDNNGVKYKFTRTLNIAESMVSKIVSLSKGTTWSSGASGLYEVSYAKEDGTTIGKDYRYIGANVHNYVKFNNDMYQIIGVFDENTHGISGEYLVKLILADKLTANSWGVVNTGANTGTYSNYYNDWTGKQYATPANLNILLNQYFLNKTDTSTTYGSCSEWTYFLSDNRYKTKDCQTLVGYGIDDSIRDYIETTTWHLNGYSSNTLTSNNFYLCERGMYTDCTSANSGAADTSTSAKIGLMYPSDYMYASGYKASSSTTTGSSSDNGSQNWMFKGTEWTITPKYSSVTEVLVVNNVGIVTSDDANLYFSSKGLGFRPTFYLKSNIKITGGEGTFENPYKIG